MSKQAKLNEVQRLLEPKQAHFIRAYVQPTPMDKPVLLWETPRNEKEDLDFYFTSEQAANAVLGIMKGN